MSETTTTDEGEDYPVKIGDVIDGRFRIDRFVGMGAMGLVVEAFHQDLGERVAIKFLRPSARKNEDAVLRFAREARAAARLKSEHVARVHDVGETADGTPYIVMEYLRGINLDEFIVDHGRFREVDKAVLVVIQVCEAIAEAHSLGIVHRDIKPANLFVLADDGAYPRVKLLDFGISKAALTGEYTNIELDATKTTAIMGSPYYMAPEQVRSTRDVDARADIWALGAVLFELLTGKPVWRSEELGQLVSEIIAHEPRRLREVAPEMDPALESVLAGALTKDVDARYSSAAAFAAALEPFAPPGRAAVHVERAQSYRTQGGSGRSLPSLRTSSRDLVAASARPGRSTSSSLSLPAGRSSSSSVSIALGIAVIALLGIVTALVLRRPAASAPAASAPVATVASAPLAPAAPPPAASAAVAPAAPAAGEAHSAPTPVAAAAGHAPPPWRGGPRAPAPAGLPNARVAKPSASPATAEPAPSKPPAPAPAPAPANGLDSDPFRKNQPKLEDNPFK